MSARQDGWSVPEMRLLPASRLLAIRREVAAMGLEDALEQSLYGNAMVLAACCVENGREVFADGQAVLDRLTAAQMERLLRLYAEKDRQACPTETEDAERAANSGFDEERFLRLKEDG
ncbi:MAG: hypothetical protein ACI3W8_05785 [Oscillospiraceae bacterium]